jgi:hypothetical protein
MTSSQIFKNNIPINILFELLDKISIKHDTFYTFDNDCYKKGIYNKSINDFIEQCMPYYHTSKQVYLTKPLTYRSFTTIIRQICNANKIKFLTEIKYNKSCYSIIYQIFMNNVCV